ncbi:unannotated protein [freshwater metagenome]|uniref:Unannotated protein n=1 Tax=freshwater metagenome TaxID=449393 RepID=A0A6J7GYU1_9ZZZZ
MIVYDALSATSEASVKKYRTNPVTTMTRMPATNRYVGTAKLLPDSRSPRRFAAARNATRPTASSTRCSASAGNAEMMLSVPEATDTATVIT